MTKLRTHRATGSHIPTGQRQQTKGEMAAASDIGTQHHIRAAQETEGAAALRGMLPIWREVAIEAYAMLLVLEEAGVKIPQLESLRCSCHQHRSVLQRLRTEAWAKVAKAKTRKAGAA